MASDTAGLGEKLKTKIKDAGAAAKQRAAKRAEGALRDDRVELLHLIVNRNKTDYYVELLKSFDINMQLISLAHGTASASRLALLHLNDSEKALIMGFVQASKIKDALAVLNDKFKTVRGGAGIAFTVPLTGVIGTRIFGFLSNNHQAIK